MADMMTLEATAREKLGSANSRQLRRQGLTPAVLYGKKMDNVNLSLDTVQFADALRQHARILSVKLPGGGEEQAVIKEIAWDELTDEILHVDLSRVDLDERIQVDVEVALVGDSKGVMQGGMLQHVLHELPVECRAGAIPDAIKHDISELGIEGVVRVGELALPEGVTTSRAADEMVCQILPPKRGEDLTVEGEAAAEPELVAKPKKEGGEG
jgi:large subunit ribosomal protein L25